MSKSHANAYRSTDQDQTRHSREDALTDRQFIRLLEAARELDSPQDFETRVILFATGRLGLRAGELAHFRAEWIDERERVLRIPSYQDCQQGTDGGICGYCRNRARDWLETHTVTHDEALEVLRDDHPDLSEDALSELAAQRVDDNPTFEDGLARRWQPKTEMGARTIPYDTNTRLEICIERFADRYDRFPKSKATINRRVNTAAELADLETNVYPHALRATAASTHAYREVSPYALMALMGWSDLDTAKTYIQASDENAAREVRSKYR